MAQTYRHFCPTARALEKIGEKWTLLIVRDLLQGPKRFTDLISTLNNITPAWLTLRLRELESSGIIERDSEPGRREVWYLLTTSGKDLAPVVKALTVWGLRYAMRPPLPDEVVHHSSLMRGLIFSLNRRGRRLPQPVKWSMRFPQVTYTLSFENYSWSGKQGEVGDADVTVTTTPDAWALLFTTQRSERSKIAATMKVEGTPERVEEFFLTLGIRADENLQISADMKNVGQASQSRIKMNKRGTGGS